MISVWGGTAKVIQKWSQKKIGESSVHALWCFSYDSGRRIHSTTEIDRQKLARDPSMYFPLFLTVLAAEYTALLEMA